MKKNKKNLHRNVSNSSKKISELRNCFIDNIENVFNSVNNSDLSFKLNILKDFLCNELNLLGNVLDIDINTTGDLKFLISDFCDNSCIDCSLDYYLINNDFLDLDEDDV